MVIFQVGKELSESIGMMLRVVLIISSYDTGSSSGEVLHFLFIENVGVVVVRDRRTWSWRSGIIMIAAECQGENYGKDHCYENDSSDNAPLDVLLLFF